MSKRGSAIARRVIHTLTLQSISTSRTGEDKNPVLRYYYLKKCEARPKLVAICAVSHKVCNIIFAILRDKKPFEIITPKEHIKQYNVDAGSGYVHTITGTSANMHDVSETANLIREDDRWYIVTPVILVLLITSQLRMMRRNQGLNFE